MKTLRIVSADRMEAEALYTALVRKKQFRVLPVLRDGRELLERYMEERTDVLLIDLELPGIDGLEIVEAVSSLPLLRRPQLFVMTEKASPTVLERMGQQIAYCFLKPLDAQQTAEQLYALTRGEPRLEGPDYGYVDYLVTNTLFRLGVPPHLQGYHLLREAIKLVNCADHPAGLSVMKDIYPASARLCGTSVSMAEHAMRHAIECAWMRADINTIQTGCGRTSTPSRPSSAIPWRPIGTRPPTPPSSTWWRIGCGCGWTAPGARAPGSWRRRDGHEDGNEAGVSAAAGRGQAAGGGVSFESGRGVYG